MGLMKKVFNLKSLGDFVFTTIGVVIVAWLIGILVGLMTGFGVWSSVITAIIALVLLSMAVGMNPGKEDVVGIVMVALKVAIVLGLLAAFGINLFTPVFELGTFLGWAIAIAVLVFGSVLGRKIAKFIPGMG